VVLARCSGRDTAGPHCVSISTPRYAARCLGLAIWQRRRKLFGMSRDDLSTFVRARGRSCSSPPRWFKAQIEAGGPVMYPPRGDVRTCVLEPVLTEAAHD
jgi:hypothetical protein